MLTPVVLDSTILLEIERIGKLRFPNEACGVIIPTPWRDQRVWEVPNRSLTPRDEFAMHSEDIVIQLQEWLNDQPGPVTWPDLVLWHTHPSGSTEPSRADVENRIPHCGNLVVALTDQGPVATWF